MQRQAKQWKQAKHSIAFVPTMGYLHEGHISLIQRARRAVGQNGKVVVSIYVNPIQFGPQEDYQTYPRDFNRDKQQCRRNQVDLIFAPGDREMYPGRSEGTFSTYVQEEQLSQRMEGASRPSHFKGVTTVVTKLFHLVSPDIAVFGAKDYQQAAIIQRMIRDLSFPIKLILAPTHRQPDGLATSSRNEYLSPEERRQAPVLSKTLRQARQWLQERGGSMPASELKRALKKEIDRYPLAKIDYLEAFEPKTLQPVEPVTKGNRLALAVFLGKTRLIDNARL